MATISRYRNGVKGNLLWWQNNTRLVVKWLQTKDLHPSHFCDMFDLASNSSYHSGTDVKLGGADPTPTSLPGRRVRLHISKI